MYSGQMKEDEEEEDEEEDEEEEEEGDDEKKAEKVEKEAKPKKRDDLLKAYGLSKNLTVSISSVAHLLCSQCSKAHPH